MNITREPFSVGKVFFSMTHSGIFLLQSFIFVMLNGWDLVLEMVITKMKRISIVLYQK